MSLDLDIRATATVTPGAKTQRIAAVKSAKPKREEQRKQRRIFAGRSRTVALGISMGVEDLAAIDRDAEAAGLSRSTYLVECWRKVRGL